MYIIAETLMLQSFIGRKHKIFKQVNKRKHMEIW